MVIPPKAVTAVLLVGLLGLALQATHPERPRPPPRSPRARLRDGRYLAYREKGVPKNDSRYKVLVVHGLGSSKDMNLMASRELVDELGIYFLMFDRAGYGESDPNPRHSVKSEALDIQELADWLEIGPKFYVISISIASYPAWSCLKYIPNRLAGVALVVPVVNYWWPSLPDELTKNDYRKRMVQWSVRASRFVPGLLQWCLTRLWFPSSSSLERSSFFFSRRDMDALKNTTGFPMLSQEKLRQRGVFDSLRQDFMAAFGDWGFDPLALSNPFPRNESSVHIWQGYEDKVVPLYLQRFVSQKLPWIQYHEVRDGGHLIVHYAGLCEAILRSLLLGEDPLSFRPIEVV